MNTGPRAAKNLPTDIALGLVAEARQKRLAITQAARTQLLECADHLMTEGHARMRGGRPKVSHAPKPLPPHKRVAPLVVRTLKQLGPVPTPTLAAALGWEQKNAATRLGRLVTLGLIVRDGTVRNPSGVGPPVSVWRVA